MALSTVLSNGEAFREKDAVFPITLQEDSFTTVHVGNIDHNSTFTTTPDSFPWQHPALGEKVVTSQLVTATNTRKLMHLPEYYIYITPVTCTDVESGMQELQKILDIYQRLKW